MAELFAIQQRLMRSLERALDNFKKLGRNNYTPAKIRIRMASLKDVWNQIQEMHDRLHIAIPSADRAALEYYREEAFERAEETFQAALDHMAEWLEELEPVVSANQSLTSAPARYDAPTFSSAHLPPIRLPPFDGNYEEWEGFRDRFTALIRENKELNDFACMHFLTSCLKGRALECISNIPVTADNFEIAWRALVARYENPRRLHLASLLNLGTITRESASELQLLCDKMNIAVASLRSLNRTPEALWNDMLVYVVVQNSIQVHAKLEI